MRLRTLALAPLASLALVACSSSGSDVKSPASAGVTVSEPASTAAPTAAPATGAPTTQPPATETPPTEASASSSAPAAAGAAEVGVSLTEWKITPSGTIGAGEVTFNVTNDGQFPHEMVVLKGDGYATYPQEANGAVIIDQLAADSVLGEVDKLAAGGTGSLTVTLAPGHYTLICNLVGGGSSHAKRGQVTELDVA